MRVLLSGPDFHDYNKFVANAIEGLDHEVEVSGWPELWGKFNRRVRLYFARQYYEEYRFQEYVLEVIDDVVQSYNDWLLKRIRETEPDAFLVLNGKVILPETVREASEHTTTIIWCYDKATVFPAVIESLHEYDLFYVFESSDVEELGDRHSDVTFLPMGYDPTYYHDLDGQSDETEPDGREEETSIDVIFVGSLSERRKRLLGRIARELDVNLQVWGNNWSWYDPFAQFEYRVQRRALGDCVNNYNIPAARVNEEYNRSKICLNIHGPHSQRAMNPRTFEILGAGAFELVDYKPRLPEVLELGEEIVTFQDGDELLEQIEYYLDRPKERRQIAAAGNERVRADHTYQDRLSRVFEDYRAL